MPPATAANTVIETLNEVATEANPRYTEFITSLIAWVGRHGQWVDAQDGPAPPASSSTSQTSRELRQRDGIRAQLTVMH